MVTHAPNQLHRMIARSRRETVTFHHSAHVAGVDRELPPGDYEVVTDEEMIEGLSFAIYRRVATMIIVPGASPHHNAMEMIAITSTALADARHRDAVTVQGRAS